MQLTGKVALVTGRFRHRWATAQLFAKEGAKVGLLGRTKKNLKKLC